MLETTRWDKPAFFFPAVFSRPSTTESSLILVLYTSWCAAAQRARLSSSCTLEIILLLCSPTLQMYYSYSYPSPHQDMNREAEGRDIRDDREAGVSQACSHAAKMFLCVCVCMHTQQSPSVEQHIEWEITTGWGSALHKCQHQTPCFISLYDWLQLQFMLLKSKNRNISLSTKLKGDSWI